MPLNHAYVGRVYPAAAPYRVGREKIREFADAIGADDAVYRDPQAARELGYPDTIAPPTFPIVISMAANQVMFDDPGLGLDFRRVVHGDQRFRYVRPVHAGDSLSCDCVIEEITSRAGHDFVTSRSDITAEDGEPVVTVWARLVVRGED
jgi:acyl dehydratase